MDAQLAKDAERILDNMISMTREKRLDHVGYVAGPASALVRERAERQEEQVVCTGPHACLIGTMYISADVPVKHDEIYPEELVLDGTEEEEREEFMADKPALKLVYDTMNEIAGGWLERNKKHPRAHNFPVWSSAAEAYFEEVKPQNREIVRLANTAKRRIKAQVSQEEELELVGT